MKLTQIRESVEDRGILKAVFVTGTPGAGKSYTISKITDGQIQPRVINSDTMLNHLHRMGRVDARQPGAWKLPGIGDTVIRTTRTKLIQSINSMLPMFIDSTCADPGAILRRKAVLESIGYDVGLIWVDVDLETSLRRAAERERSEEQRHVPPDFIRSVHEYTENARQFLETKFDWVKIINNSDGEFTDDVVKQAYVQASTFFRAPVQNPIGRRLVATMKETGDKYLAPSQYSLDEIGHLTSVWYKR